MSKLWNTRLFQENNSPINYRKQALSLPPKVLVLLLLLVSRLVDANRGSGRQVIYSLLILAVSRASKLISFALLSVGIMQSQLGCVATCERAEYILRREERRKVVK